MFYCVHCFILFNLYLGDEDDIMKINDEEIDLSRFEDGNTSSLNDGFCDISYINLDFGNESD